MTLKSKADVYLLIRWRVLLPGLLSLLILAVVLLLQFQTKGLARSYAQAEPSRFGDTILIQKSNKNIQPAICPSLVHIEAENYYWSKKLSTAICTDFGGGYALERVSALSSGTYPVFLSYTGKYRVHFRAASASKGGMVELYQGEALVVKQKLSYTGGWQHWKTSSATAQLESGKHDLTLRFSGNSGSLFNLNWIELEYKDTSLLEQSTQDDDSISPLDLTVLRKGISILLPESISFPLKLEIIGLDGGLYRRQTVSEDHVENGRFNLIMEYNSGVYAAKLYTADSMFLAQRFVYH